MFTHFSKLWTPATVASALKPGAPLALQVAGERLVLFRDRAGLARALVDTCPHRGVRLSLGKVTPDGCLECPFHAWKFGGDGKVVHVPLNPDAKRERLFAPTLSVRELGGVIWLWTEVNATPTTEPLVPEALLMDDVAKTYHQVEWKAHWTRAMENMLDSPHVPFVHASTIGRFVRPLLRPDSSMDIAWEDTPWGGQTTSSLDGNPAGGAALRFYKPNMMELQIPMNGTLFRMHAFCVPVDDAHVRMIIVGVRGFAKWRGLNPLFNWANQRIAEEDRRLVESSWPREVPPPGQELSVRTDRATLQFRKYYFAELKAADIVAPT